MPEPTDLQGRHWDVLVVGTGMGGATLGYALARAGRSVLFCEKGRSHLADGPALRGDFAEGFFPHPAHPGPEHREILTRAGRYPESIADASGARVRRFIPFVGSGTGGSTALYGMALERFFPADFTPRRHHPGATDATLPEAWPIGYDEMAPYYEAAERLFRVRGAADPCRADHRAEHLLPPPPLSPAAASLRDFLAGKGLHVYQVPLACEFVPGCPCCQSYLCDRQCKNDAARVCLRPALEHHGAELLAECEVAGLEGSRTAITAVRCRHRGRELTLRADVVVLAAGALESARLLLASADPQWPDGLANDSGLVGRNLMRHYVDLYAIAPPGRRGDACGLKELAFNDLYLADGQKLGTVQSFGVLPPPLILVAGMEEDLRAGPRPWAASLLRAARPVVGRLVRGMLSGRVLLASIIEDLPYEDNRATPPQGAGPGSGDRLVLEYRIRDYDRTRIAAMRARLREILRPLRFTLLKQAENNERLAHACGTCRFGTDPRRSVLDPWNRAHGLANLYVVDGSFFPSSGGTNPALTIAANALRVADHLLGRGPAAGGPPP
jgi:choline dehydrogenase-like flavoprotein